VFGSRNDDPASETKEELSEKALNTAIVEKLMNARPEPAPLR
jgi:hypothetical protein